MAEEAAAMWLRENFGPPPPGGAFGPFGHLVGGALGSSRLVSSRRGRLWSWAAMGLAMGATLKGRGDVLVMWADLRA